RRDYAGLFRVPRIALLDRDDGKLSRPRLMGPDATNIRHASFFEFFPEVGGARDGAEQSERVRRPGRIGAGENRIIPVENAFHANEGLETARTRIVAGPFAEGAFFSQLARSNFTLEDDFRFRGIRQAGDIAANHSSRRSAQAAGKIELAHS